MDSATLFRVILFWHVLSLVYSVVPLAKKTKLCGNEACSEKLFDGKFHRSMGANDERFLAPKVDDSVSIYAIKFSDRTDLMEGALTREPERRGSFFSSYITLDGYVDFLRSAVESNKTLFMISTDPHDHPAKKLVGLKSAYPELIRDYEVNSQRLVDEGIIPQAVPLNLTALDPKVVEALSHDHSHSGHGHSHGGIGYEDVHSHNPPPVAIQPPPTKGPVAELSSDPASASLPSQQSPPVQQQPSLTQQQPPPVQQQPLPVQQQPLGVQQQPPPVQQQPSPVQQQSPPVQQQSPPVQQQPPPVQQQPSPVQQQSPSVQQQPPPTQQQPPPVQQQSSPVQQQSPPLQQQPSSVQQHPPPTQQQPPPVQQQPPPVQQQPLPVQQQPPLVQQQSPPSKQQPSPHHQQSSPVQEQSPTQHQSSPTVERPSSYSQQSNSAETLAGGRPPVAAANSATISSSEHVNEDTSIKNGESANDTMQHLTDSIEMPISNGTNASETKNTKPEWESADNVHTISGKQMKDSGSSEEMTNTTSRDENMHGYCIKGDCDKVYTEQPTTEQTQSSATPETSQSQSVAQSVPPLPSSQERSTETVNEQQQPDHFHETRVFQQSIDRDHQAGPAEPSQVAANHQATGQQQPAAFGNQPSQVNAIDPQKPVSEESSGVGKWLSKVISLFRYALPPPLAGIDDAGVVVTLMVPICLITHVLRTLFLSDNSEQDAFDRRALHDALTAVRERDEQIKILRVEAEKVHGIASRGKDEKIEQLELDLGQGKLEIQQLRNRCGHLEETNKRLKKEADEARKLAENERCEVNALCDEKKQFERSAQMLSDQIAEMQSTMENAREKNEKLEDELADKNALIARLETEARISAVEVKKLTAQLQTSVEEGAMLRDRVDALQNETVQLSEMIDELSKAREVTTSTDSAPHADDHGAHESGGSAGWSDIGDFDIETSPSEEKKQATTGNQSRKEKEGSPSKAHPADIMEVARLRAQLKRLETDLDQAKLALQKEENLHEHLTRKIELAELEATERKKEAEAKEAERVDTHNQCKKMLIMVEERDAKIRRSEEVTERLRDEVNKWQTEVRHLEEQNRRIQNKLNEAEQELKRLRAENNRLETRHFHELRECKQTIGALQQSLEASQLAAISKSPDGGNLLNLSSNGSSDREFGAPFVSHLGPPPLPTIRPLWGDDEPVEIFSAGESSVLSGGGLRGTTLPDDLSGVAVKKGARSRRSHREPRDTSPDLGGQYAARPKKEGRRRSRSHGRHPYSSGGSYMPQVGGMPPAFPDLFNGPPLSKRNSKSGNLYYSSGGSNGGLSPPPEMALLSGVPPPGMTIKKPTATSRPKSVTEQMSRLQN
uniref:Uncharacterized protein n=1 Tax=Parascaris univalens TaxID=6257 RepID=A0A914ZE37_PARUN